MKEYMAFFIPVEDMSIHKGLTLDYTDPSAPWHFFLVCLFVLRHSFATQHGLALNSQYSCLTIQSAIIIGL